MINARIWGLLNDWETGDANARRTDDEWGVPLRPEDEAELEFRESYIEQAGPVLNGLVSGSGSTGYAGYKVSHEEGGILYVGFTQDQQAQVDALKPSLAAPSDRVRAFPTQPQRSIADLNALRSIVHSEGDPGGPLAGQVVWVSVEAGANRLLVGATNVGLVQSSLDARYGTGVARVVYATPPIAMKKKQSRFNSAGPVQAGDRVVGSSECTVSMGGIGSAGFKRRDHWINRYFLIEAGHCFSEGEVIGRMRRDTTHFQRLGKVAYRPFNPFTPPDGPTQVDAESIDVGDKDEVPRAIFRGARSQIPIRGSAGVPPQWTTVCSSGARSMRVGCGPVISTETDTDLDVDRDGVGDVPVRQVQVAGGDMAVLGGDSGSPVWIQGTGIIVGSVSGGGGGVAFNGTNYGSCVDVEDPLYPNRTNRKCPIMFFTPVGQFIGPGGGSPGGVLNLSLALHP